jgi:hypothetical protein
VLEDLSDCQRGGGHSPKRARVARSRHHHPRIGREVRTVAVGHDAQVGGGAFPPDVNVARFGRSAPLGPQTALGIDARDSRVEVGDESVGKSVWDKHKLARQPSQRFQEERSC